MGSSRPDRLPGAKISTPPDAAVHCPQLGPMMMCVSAQYVGGRHEFIGSQTDPPAQYEPNFLPCP